MKQNCASYNFYWQKQLYTYIFFTFLVKRASSRKRKTSVKSLTKILGINLCKNVATEYKLLPGMIEGLHLHRKS